MEKLAFRIASIDIRDAIIFKAEIAITGEKQDVEALDFLLKHKGKRIVAHELRLETPPPEDNQVAMVFSDGDLDICKCSHERRFHELDAGLVKCTVVGCDCQSFELSYVHEQPAATIEIVSWDPSADHAEILGREVRFEGKLYQVERHETIGRAPDGSGGYFLSRRNYLDEEEPSGENETEKILTNAEQLEEEGVIVGPTADPGEIGKADDQIPMIASGIEVDVEGEHDLCFCGHQRRQHRPASTGAVCDAPGCSCMGFNLVAQATGEEGSEA